MVKEKQAVKTLTVEEMHKAFNDSYKFLKARQDELPNIDWQELATEVIKISKDNGETALINGLLASCCDHLQKVWRDNR